nr:unnamed protein product [Callosobruchus chinensis]CAH7743971.1 unnamed protein product [Callosobruchus chinensis]
MLKYAVLSCLVAIAFAKPGHVGVAVAPAVHTAVHSVPVPVAAVTRSNSGVSSQSR